MHRAAGTIAVVLTLLSGGAIAHPPVGIVVDDAGIVFTASGPMGGVHRIAPDGTVSRLLPVAARRTLFNTHHVQWTPDRRSLITAPDRGGRLVRIDRGVAATTTDVYPRSGEGALGDVGLGGDPFLVEPDGTILVGRSSFRRYAQIIAIAPDGQWRVRAGGAWGVVDGPGATARFESLHGTSFARAEDGTVYFIDGGRRLRALAPDDTVRTLAGGADDGERDGVGAHARFRGALGVGLAPEGVIIVGDAGNRRLRRVAPDGTVTTLAGDGRRADVDGPALAASFIEPAGVTVGRDGTIYVRDQRDETHVAIRVVRDGRVSTLARIEGAFMDPPEPTR